MKMIFFVKAFFALLIFLPLTVAAQIKNNAKDYPKNIGINIDQTAFDLLVKQGINRMNINKPVDIKYLINLVRLYNTIVFTGDLREKNKNDNKFCDLFDANEKYDKLFISMLHARRSVGLGYYSKQYNIYLGGMPDGNSKFKIKL